ncbi:hypothetical protein R50345_25220 [Paenibacillus sp. FSL R5-0345]|uniref:hypothetical protein n=1 Tax=Paenibacillus sp. FSL R5-0345 TaxID=1536770 RepID=UPI0004F8F697|nr:hypothetical protein [Paenibacillus sp. FSL R5-0345]AIQ37635.1 hypothetical protein R50345_25220 [Paenibacillus sp. FSL R5-0345]
MALETFGVKVNPEIKEKVNSMISASGLNHKEWFESVVALYELQMYKHHDNAKKYLSDLEALQEHTSRINEIFTSLIKKIIDDNSHNTTLIEKITLEKQVLIEDLEQQVQTQNRELVEVTRDLSEIRKSWKQLEELNYAHKETIFHLQSELERQNILISEFNQGEFVELSNELRGVKQTLELTTLRHEKEVQELIAQHRQEIIEKYMSKSKITGEKKKGRPPKKDTPEQNSPIDVSSSQNSSNNIDLTKEQEE